MLSMRKKVVCFDLDDTLYKEIDFLESAYGEIATSVGKAELVSLMMKWYYDSENVFHNLNQYLRLNKPITEYLSIYRNHIHIYTSLLMQFIYRRVAIGTFCIFDCSCNCGADNFGG